MVWPARSVDCSSGLVKEVVGHCGLLVGWTQIPSMILPLLLLTSPRAAMVTASVSCTEGGGPFLALYQLACTQSAHPLPQSLLSRPPLWFYCSLHQNMVLLFQMRSHLLAAHPVWTPRRQQDRFACHPFLRQARRFPCLLSSWTIPLSLTITPLLSGT